MALRVRGRFVVEVSAGASSPACKTHLDRAMPLVGDALTVIHLRARARQPGVLWVFPDAHGWRSRLIESAWLTALKHARVELFRFHDLRHTFVSYMAMSGASLRDIAELLGHKNIQQTM